MSAGKDLMRILHTLRKLERGGAETLVLDVCRNARQFGLDVSFATFLGGKMENDFRESGAEYIDLKKLDRADPALLVRLRSLVQRSGFGIVHCHTAVEAVYAYTALIGTGKKVVLTYHGMFFEDPNVRRMIKFLMPRISLNVFCSETMRRFYEERYPQFGRSRTEVVYNGIDPKRLSSEKEEFRVSFDIERSSLLIGTVANFRKPKDPLTVCEALAWVFERHQFACFVFVGGTFGAEDDALLSTCRRRCRELGIEDRVTFAGALSSAGPVLSEMDVFVMSSLEEGLPLAVIEAMIAGVPVVATDIGAHREISENGEYALLFEPGDREGLAANLDRLLSERSRASQLANEARRHASRHFTIEAHLRSLLTAYESLTEM